VIRILLGGVCHGVKGAPYTRAMPEDAGSAGNERERSLVIAGLLFVVMTPVFIPSAAAAFGIGAALERRGSRRRAAIVLLPAVFVFTVTLIQILK
jgi:hypothetical protein